MFIIVGKRKPTKDHPKPVTVVWDGTREGSLLVGRAKAGTRAYCDETIESLKTPTAPVDWFGIVEMPEEFGK